MSDATWLSWGVPIVGLICAAFSGVLALVSVWSFDRRYGKPKPRP